MASTSGVAGAAVGPLRHPQPRGWGHACWQAAAVHTTAGAGHAAGSAGAASAWRGSAFAAAAESPKHLHSAAQAPAQRHQPRLPPGQIRFPARQSAPPCAQWEGSGGCSGGVVPSAGRFRLPRALTRPSLLARRLRLLLFWIRRASSKSPTPGDLLSKDRPVGAACSCCCIGGVSPMGQSAGSALAGKGRAGPCGPSTVSSPAHGALHQLSICIARKHRLPIDAPPGLSQGSLGSQSRLWCALEKSAGAAQRGREPGSAAQVSDRSAALFTVRLNNMAKFARLATMALNLLLVLATCSNETRT